MKPKKSNVALLIIADAPAQWRESHDSTWAILRAARRRGWRVWLSEPRHLLWQSVGTRSGVHAWAREVDNTGPQSEAFATRAPQCIRLADCAATLMRKDPPFDAEYFHVTHLLSQAEREGARVFNAPLALREQPEKLCLLSPEFARWAAPTLVSAHLSALRAFHAEHGDVIFKPLDAMGGRGVFRIRADGMNLGATLEMLTDYGARAIMAQRFIPAIAQGDKRILVIGGQAVPHALARIPEKGEVRGNLAAGGLGVAQKLSANDQAIVTALAPILQQRGILLAGLDVIGDYLTEVNITSPTCFMEILAQTGFDCAAMFMGALETELASKFG